VAGSAEGESGAQRADDPYPGLEKIEIKNLAFRVVLCKNS
jgi:hypothetical protein